MTLDFEMILTDDDYQSGMLRAGFIWKEGTTYSYWYQNATTLQWYESLEYYDENEVTLIAEPVLCVF